MKILHIITTMSAGGAERMLSKLVKEDQENEHQVITLFRYKGHYNIDGSKIFKLNYSHKNINKIRVIKDIIKVILREKPDIIQTWMKANFYGSVIKIFTNAKLISNYRNGFLGKNRKFNIKVLNIINKSFDGNIFVSDSTYRERKDVSLVYKHPIIINNGFENQRYNYKLQDIFTVGYIGRYHKIKNQQVIIDAFDEFSENKDVQLIMAGYRLEENLYHNEKENIKFLGKIENVNSFYEKIDLLLLTSQSEGFPNVIGEAMSHGVPVLTTNAGESWDIIGDSGYKLKAPDKKKLNNMLNDIYIDRGQLLLKSKEAYKRVNRLYSITNSITAYQQYYRKIGENK